MRTGRRGGRIPSRTPPLFGLELKEPWASAVLDGSKTIETRTYDLPAALVGKPLILLSTPEESGGGDVGAAGRRARGAAVARALATFAETRGGRPATRVARTGVPTGCPRTRTGPTRGALRTRARRARFEGGWCAR